MTLHHCTDSCGQVWEVFAREDREPDEAYFTLYATKTITTGRFPVEQGASFYEGDTCPTCAFPLGDILTQDRMI